ncbi:MAG TPA: hypothetical protein VHZ81_08755 [Galbitalea sp.]|jgi:hypothetical protein|nr:hypothetical protein [Galbitalea sp.]
MTASPTTPGVRVRREGDAIRIETDTYRLELRRIGAGFDRFPIAHLSDGSGVSWLTLNLLSSVHTAAQVDETFTIGEPSLAQEGDDVVLTIGSRGTAWRSRMAILRCTPDHIDYSVTVEGDGAITDVTLLGGDAALPGGAAGTFRSGIRFPSVFSPTPSEPIQVVRASSSAVALGVVGDAEPGRLNAVFSPPPLVLGLGRNLASSPTGVPEGDWLGMSIVAPVDQLTFSTLRYEPIDGGFLLRLNYDGHTLAKGRWTSPVVVLRPAPNGWRVIDDYCRDLGERGFAPTATATAARWWLEPIFCGWGAQCARYAAASTGNSPRAGEAAEAGTSLAGAPDYARQSVYDELLGTLRHAGLEPGTIVVDDRWQAEYGTGTPDLEHWPDLKGWIADRHAEGHRVLLWWKAWDPEGIPLTECILDAAGTAVSVDPANPEYLNHLSGIVRSLLGPEGLDADGFKVDFTQRAPTGRTLVGHPGPWGIGALHALLRTLYVAAKDAKLDAMIITHAMHPSFGDVTDVVRLNDVLERDPEGVMVPVVDQLLFRHGVASRALPGHPIDTDQWPMPSRAEWLNYVRTQGELGIPALYYVESIDATNEAIDEADLTVVARTWTDYRARLGS